MPRSNGIETLVSIYRQIRSVHCVIQQGKLAREFKQECLSPSVKPESYDIFAQFRNGQFSKLNDEERLNEQLQECENLVILRQGTDAVSALKSVLQPKDGNSKAPYSWIHDLPDEVKNLTVTEKDAAKLEKSLEKICCKLFLRLDFCTSELQLIVHDKDNVLPTTVDLLIKWVQRNTQNATLGTLLKELVELEEVEPGQIDWGKIQTVVENKLMEKTQTDSRPELSCSKLKKSSGFKLNKSAGIETPVIVYHEVSRSHIVVAQQITVENFKKEFISSTAATDSYDVLVQYNDGTAERVSDPQILDEQLQKCQSLLLLPKENVDIISQRNPVTELNSVRNPNYSWVDELPEKVMNLRIKERDAVALPASLEKILHQLMLILEFKKGELEIAVLDSKKNSLPGVNYQTNLITKWLHKDPKSATFGTLLKEMIAYEDVNQGLIDWNMMRRIVTNASLKMESA